jgi:hypothetical protein
MASVQEFDIRSAGDALLIPCEFDGETRPFVLDSGCGVNTLDLTALEKFKGAYGTTKLKTEAGTVDVPYLSAGQLSEFPKIVLAGEKIDSTAIWFVDLAPLRRAIDRDFAGVLGLEFFCDHVVQIDYAAGKLRIMDWRTEPDDWGVEIPLKFDTKARQAVVERIQVAGRELTALLDTGSSFSLTVDETVFDDLVTERRVNRQFTTRAWMAGARSATDRMAGYVDEVRIGPFRQVDVPVAQTHGPAVIGNQFLRRFTVTIDLAAQCLFLKPREEFTDSGTRPLSGMGLVRINGKLVVDSCVQESPADRAGLREGDIVEEFNGTPSDQCDILDIRLYCSSEVGKTVRLRLASESNADDREVEFILREY